MVEIASKKTPKSEHMAEVQAIRAHADQPLKAADAAAAAAAALEGQRKAHGPSITFDADSGDWQHALDNITQSSSLRTWVRRAVALCKPDRVHFVVGSADEKSALCDDMVRTGMLTKLNDELRPNSYLARSDAKDVARLESRTFICCDREEDAGPTNVWAPPAEMRATLQGKFDGCMRGRTMYVVPFSMGPLDSPLARRGVQVTDSPYVAVSLTIMTRVTPRVYQLIDRDNGFFVPCMHSVGAPRGSPRYDSSWPSNEDKYIVHFTDGDREEAQASGRPVTREIWSYGSGYGGNALLPKKCFALRIASLQARDEGWLAEHMLIASLTNPEGKKVYFAAAFPSACGKTNLAMMKPSLPGWDVKVVGDDIAWMRFNPRDGRLYATNPENGFFGVAPGTSRTSNPHAMDCLEHDCVFTNVALTRDGDVWWEGMGKDELAEQSGALTDWHGNSYDHSAGEPAAHRNSRFAAPLRNCPILDEDYERPEGVPISFILFGARRRDTVPLVAEARSWAHGVLMGATLRSEVTAAASDVRRKLRYDPMAQLPFMSYNMASYWQHWIDVGRRAEEAGQANSLPLIASVNWFRRDSEGKFIWSGFGDNARVLSWLFDRALARQEGRQASAAVESPIGLLPRPEDINLDGIRNGMTREQLRELLSVDKAKWQAEMADHEKFFDGSYFAEDGKSERAISAFVQRVPRELRAEMKSIREALDALS